MGSLFEKVDNLKWIESLTRFLIFTIAYHTYFRLGCVSVKVCPNRVKAPKGATNRRKATVDIRKRSRTLDLTYDPNICN